VSRGGLFFGWGLCLGVGGAREMVDGWVLLVFGGLVLWGVCRKLGGGRKTHGGGGDVCPGVLGKGRTLEWQGVTEKI